MDRLEAMQVLVDIANAGSLSAAARHLNMPLATVSRKLADLEKHLQTRLIIRSTRRLTLTEAGEAYVATCKRILEEVEQAEKLVAGEYTEPKGDLVLTAPVVLGRMHVLPIINDFLKAYPNINIRAVFVDRWINLIEEHVDIAVRVGQLPDSGLVALPVGAARQVVCASPEYFKRHRPPVRPGDLFAHACVAFEGALPSHAWLFAENNQPVSTPVRARLVVNSAEAAIEAAIAGIGVTRVLSYQIARHVKEKKLKVVLEAFEPPALPIHLVHAGQGRLPLKLRAFLDFTVPRLRRVSSF
ncbi:MAG TPA: LysR family transcriptional regulator [Dyella sp.]|uniref:LysR family transcriptional regulator n=1 Tax=Dyella sp. TaxID=1869338 RepID=UPI002CF9C2B3|nr:LysR family transcriptional regulator [Dyella sp.]HTV85461.1 LysR family transcriptional regulator [Dyella sp.]